MSFFRQTTVRIGVPSIREQKVRESGLWASIPTGQIFSPEQMMAKEKAVEQHAQKRADCKRQAKEAGLGYTARKKFVRECMEEK